MRRLLFAIGAAATVLLAASPALGHGSRDVGDIEWVVGWAVEPAYAGQPNAVQLMLSRDGQPVTGAEDDLRVEVILGDSSTEPLPLRTVFDSPGEYRADLIPTRPGGYTFHFTGTIEGEPVDESWTGSEDGFDEVTEPASISFPDEAPTTVQLTERLEAAEQAAAEAGGGSTALLILSVVAVVASLVAVVSAVVTARR